MASTFGINPANFTVANLQSLKEAQRQLHDLLPLMDRAAECGVPVEGYRAIATGLQEQLAAIEKNFMGSVQS